MELLFTLGLVALVIIVAVGALLFLQQRRSGTIRAVVPPRRASRDEPGAGDGDGAAAEQ